MRIYHIKHFITCHTPARQEIPFSCKQYHSYRMPLHELIVRLIVCHEVFKIENCTHKN